MPGSENTASMKRACSSSAIAGQAAVHFVRLDLGKDRDAVEALLAMRFDVIAERLDLEPRESLRRSS